MTWAALHRAIEATRAGLVDVSAETVALVVDNRIEDIILLVSALRGGFDVALFGPRTPDIDLARSIEALDAVLLDRTRAVESDVPVPLSDIRLSGHTLISTSGSTDAARWIRHPASAHLASAEAATQRLNLSEGDGWGWCLPMHHVGGLSILWRCAIRGACAISPPSDTPLPEWIAPDGQGPKPTHVSMVPTQLRDLLDGGQSPPSVLRSVIVGGAHISCDLLERAIQAGWPVRTTYGMTETASMVTLSDVWTVPPTEHVHAGTPLTGVEMKVDDGRMAIRSRALGSGLADSEGWFRTFDRGFQDESGRWVVTGRADRVIISGGENLDPDRIERAVRSLPGVEECIVVSVPHDRYGQRPVAFVSGLAPIPGRDDLAAALSRTLVSFEIPDAFHPMPPLEPGQAKWSRSGLEALARSEEEGR